jgi:phosphoribosylanthranilate isomerase
MIMPLLKICGVTRIEDAVLACSLGFDAVGMVFAKSPRMVGPDRAREISRSLPSSVLKVGVFVDHEEKEVKRLMEFCSLDLVQLHGDESPSQAARFGSRAIKALRPRSPEELDMLDHYPHVFAVLLDAWDAGLRGGTGKACDWGLAAQAARGRRIILAGGLNPKNVEGAIAQVHPFGVDVCSGVELSPGIKDHELMRQFARRARSGFSPALHEECDDVGK